MKKSNRVFIALIATLYIVPALTFGAAQFTSEKCLTGFTQKFQIIQIDNPELKAENIKVDTRTASEFPRHKNIAVSKKCVTSCRLWTKPQPRQHAGHAKQGYRLGPCGG